MANYRVESAFLGYVDRSSPDYFDYNYAKSENVTNSIQETFTDEGTLSIEPKETRFGYDINSALTEQYTRLYAKDVVWKLIINLRNKNNTSFSYICVRNIGIKTLINSQDKGVSRNKVLYLSLESERNKPDLLISDTAKLEKRSEQLLTALGVPAAAAKAGSEIVGGAGAVVKRGLGSLDIEFLTSDVMIYDEEAETSKKTNPNTRAFKRCLIRLAGGNLAAERAGKPYPIAKQPGIWDSGSGPVIGNDRDGTFKNNLWEAINQLRSQIENLSDGVNYISQDGKKVKVSILQSPVCIGKTSPDPTQEEINNFNSNEPMPISGTTTPTPAVPQIATSKPEPPLAKTEATINLPYSSYKSFKNLESFYKSDAVQNDFSFVKFFKVRWDELKVLADRVSTNVEYNNPNDIKQRIQIVKQNISDKSEESPYPIIHSDRKTFLNRQITFYGDLLKVLDKLLKEAEENQKVVKEYIFISTKQQKLHSILMEQLKKDIKRG